MKTVFLFPGQGSQFVGMGRGLAAAVPEARAVFAAADAALGMPISELCFNGPREELNKTVNTQPAVLTMSIACLRALEARGVRPDAVAGHSLGEYAALVAARALSFTDAVKLVRRRGQYMQEAVPLGSGGMLAVLGLDRERVAEIVRSASAHGVIEMANFNCPGQIVLAGETRALERAITLAKQAGARRSVMLAVSGPFHSSLMRPAGEKLAQVLQQTPLNDPSLPVVANVNGDYLETAEAVRAALVRQVYSPVLWEDSIKKLIADGARFFVEVGPGRVLTGLLKKIADREVVALNVEDEESLEKVVARLGGVG